MQNLEKLYYVICAMYPTYNWLPLQPGQPNIATNEDEFAMDIDSVLEDDSNIVNEDIEIEQEITFESEEEVFCQVYTDKDCEINRIILDID